MGEGSNKADSYLEYSEIPLGLAIGDHVVGIHRWAAGFVACDSNSRVNSVHVKDPR